MSARRWEEVRADGVEAGFVDEAGVAAIRARMQEDFPVVRAVAVEGDEP